jgi:hypothetical protein
MMGSLNGGNPKKDGNIDHDGPLRISGEAPEGFLRSVFHFFAKVDGCFADPL